MVHDCLCCALLWCREEDKAIIQLCQRNGISKETFSTLAGLLNRSTNEVGAFSFLLYIHVYKISVKVIINERCFYFAGLWQISPLTVFIPFKPIDVITWHYVLCKWVGGIWMIWLYKKSAKDNVINQRHVFKVQQLMVSDIYVLWVGRKWHCLLSLSVIPAKLCCVQHAFNASWVVFIRLVKEGKPHCIWMYYKHTWCTPSTYCLFFKPMTNSN